MFVERELGVGFEVLVEVLLVITLVLSVWVKALVDGLRGVSAAPSLIEPSPEICTGVLVENLLENNAATFSSVASDLSVCVIAFIGGLPIGAATP